MLQDLKRFIDASILKKAILLDIAYIIPSNKVKNLENIFKEIDKNGNGLISLEEMKAGLKAFKKQGIINIKDQDIEQLFRAMDVDHSG